MPGPDVGPCLRRDFGDVGFSGRRARVKMRFRAWAVYGNQASAGVLPRDATGGMRRVVAEGLLGAGPGGGKA
jgi:hypothetical protein